MGRMGYRMARKSRDKTELEADAVGYMPERFITGYFELVRMGLKVGPQGQVYDNESANVKKKYHTPAGGLRDEAALRFKAWVDRQLRAIGRDVQAYLNARDGAGPSPIGMSNAARREIARELERKTELKCQSKECGKYISWQWSYCAWCGRKILNDSTVQEQRQGGDSNVVAGGGTGEPTAAAGGQQQSSCGSRTNINPTDGTEVGRHVQGQGGAGIQGH